MFKRLLIANRGEIAVRIIRACKELGIETVTVYSVADEQALHVQLATYAVCIGEASPLDSYLNQHRILSAAISFGCDAIHPGFGFLSENSEFARRVEECGMTFVGPSPDIIDLMGDKAQARETMIKAHVPVVPGSPIIDDQNEALEYAKKIGFPVMIKATAGGGGKGMRISLSEDDFIQMFNTAQNEATQAFGNGHLYLEKMITNAKHVEVQIVGDCFGNVVHLFERDCSMQRRNQKMIEEAPCSILNQDAKQRMYDAAVNAAKAVGYNSVGTIEFLVDKSESFYFIEMNTRVQVEHPVTEMITGIDIIKEQIKIADKQPLSFTQDEVKVIGHAMECRINAEDYMNGFMPSPGKIQSFHMPGGLGVRIDSAIYKDYEIPPYYDSMIAKLIVHGKNRLECIKKMRSALEEMIIEGVESNIELHYLIMHHPQFVMGHFDTGFLTEFLKEVEESGAALQTEERKA